MKTRVTVCIMMICLSFLFAGARQASAEGADERIETLKSIIRTSMEDNDYERITEALQSLNDYEVLAWNNEDIAYFKAELRKAARKAEYNTDPVITGGMLDEAVRVFPNDFDLSIKLLKSYLELGQIKEASGLYEELVAKYSKRQEDPEFASAGFAVKASELMVSKRYSLAKAELQRAIEMDPKWTGARFIMAALDIRMKDYDAAEAGLKKILELNPYHKGAKEVLEQVLPEKKAAVADGKT